MARHRNLTPPNYGFNGLPGRTSHTAQIALNMAILMEYGNPDGCAVTAPTHRVKSGSPCPLRRTSLAARLTEAQLGGTLLAGHMPSSAKPERS